MSNEIFGPLLAIVMVDNLEDGFNIINSRPKPLAAYLFTNNKELKEKFVSDVSVGAMLINDTALHLSVPTLPFGVGESGMGGYHGKFSFDTFIHRKAVLYRSCLGDAPQRELCPVLDARPGDGRTHALSKLLPYVPKEMSIKKGEIPLRCILVVQMTDLCILLVQYLVS